MYNWSTFQSSPLSNPMPLVGQPQPTYRMQGPSPTSYIADMVKDPNGQSMNRNQWMAQMPGSQTYQPAGNTANYGVRAGTAVNPQLIEMMRRQNPYQGYGNPMMLGGPMGWHGGFNPYGGFGGMGGFGSNPWAMSAAMKSLGGLFGGGSSMAQGGFAPQQLGRYSFYGYGG